MLSLFPEILFLAPFSALLIRVATAAIFGYAASKHLTEPDMTLRALGTTEGVCALLLFLGLYAQAAALLGIALFFIHAFLPRARVLPTSSGLLLLVLCISLLVTGPGPLAFDLPL